VCGKTGARDARKPRTSPKRLDNTRRSDDSPVDDSPESPPQTEDPPSDVVQMDIPDTGTSAGAAEKAKMNSEERKCYHVYMDKMLQEYEPIWVR